MWEYFILKDNKCLTCLKCSESNEKIYGTKQRHILSIISLMFQTENDVKTNKAVNKKHLFFRTCSMYVKRTHIAVTKRTVKAKKVKKKKKKKPTSLIFLTDQLSLLCL